MLRCKSILVAIFWLHTSLALALPSLKTIHKKNEEVNDRFFSYLSLPQQTRINSFIKEINRHVTEKNSDGRNLLYTGSGDPRLPVILLIQGLPNKNGEDKLKEFYTSFAKLAHTGHSVYFQSLFKKQNYKKNVEHILATISQLQNKYPEQAILIFGHCTGGVLAALALDHLQTRNNAALNLYLYTIASPFNGYGAPGIAVLAKLFMPALTIDVGMGLGKEIKSQRLKNCQHFINTNAKLDYHSRRLGRNFPQFFNRDKSKKWKHWQQAYQNADMPCGNENTFLSDHNTHDDLIYSVIDNTLMLR